MANRKQLAILKQGVAAWNKWREEHPDAKINLRGAQLDSLDLSGANFRQANICGASFRKAVLVRADFTNTIAGNTFISSVIQFFSCLFLIPVKYFYKIVIFTSIIIVIDLTYIFIHLGTDPALFIVYSALLFIILITVTVKDNVEINILQMRYGTDFRLSNLYNAKFDMSNIECCRFDNAILIGTSFQNAHGIESVSHQGTILEDSTVRKILVHADTCKLSLKGVDLYGAYLINANLRGQNLRETVLICANLSGADITGAKLWGSARENWIIDGIRCEYVYWDEAGEQRTPPDRDFRPGEFEELYRQLPTFEYVFANGFTPLDPLIMDRVVQAINERHEEFSLELVNFDKRGEPHATFTVCHLDYVEKAKEQIAAGYEQNKIAPDQQEQLMAAVLGLIENQSKLIDKIPSSRELTMGDTYNINGGQIGAIGKKALAAGNTFQQITAELPSLHEAMRNTAASPEQKAAAEDVAKAEQAARQQDEPTMRQHLKNAGKFALDCAKEIGTEALAEYLKKITVG